MRNIELLEFHYYVNLRVVGTGQFRCIQSNPKKNSWGYKDITLRVFRIGNEVSKPSGLRLKGQSSSKYGTMEKKSLYNELDNGMRPQMYLYLYKILHD